MKKSLILTLLLALCVFFASCIQIETPEELYAEKETQGTSGTEVSNVSSEAEDDKNDREADSANAQAEKEQASQSTDDNKPSQYVVPSFEGEEFGSVLQQKLIAEGYKLSIKYEYSDTVASGVIISQSPKEGTACDKKDMSLEIIISAGKKTDNTADTEEQGDTSDKQPLPIVEKNPSVPRWIISPEIDYDFIETFGMTGYSVCKKWDSYGVIDMNGKPYGTGNYTKLFYCTEHGLSSPDVTESTPIADDLSIVPDCGFTASNDQPNIYVYDDSRSKVYLTGFSNGVFRIADITDTEIFKNNSTYIAVLYNCDADLLMYEGIGMENLADIFRAENVKMNYGVVNNSFETLVEFEYDSIKYGNDCYIVSKDGKYGYRGLSGQNYYECIFREANTAYLGAAWVKYDGKWGTVAF